MACCPGCALCAHASPSRGSGGVWRWRAAAAGEVLVQPWAVFPGPVHGAWAPALRAAAAAAQLAAPPAPAPPRGLLRGRRRCTGGSTVLPAALEEAQSPPGSAVVQAEQWLRTLFEWLQTLQRTWLRTAGPLLIWCALLGALRCGLLPRIHRLWFQLMGVLLREEPRGRRHYRQSFLSAAEVPLESLCLISIGCHVAALFSMLVLSSNATKNVVYYSGVILDLSFKICFGAVMYKVVNQRITRSSRGLARKSDILGAETSRQESQVLAVGQTARVLVILGTFLSCLPVFKVDLATVLSFCGMGGLAISLLSKGVFINLIGSLTLYLTQPFTIGDWIQTVEDGEVDGWVQSMGPYHTVVMRWDRRPLYIPNSRFMQVQIVNASRMTNRRILLEVPVRLGDLDKIDVVLNDIRDFITNHKNLDSEQHRLVRLRDISRHAAMIWVSCYTKSIKLKDFVAVREAILMGIKNIMFKNSMTFATTLEREWRRVDPTGRLVSTPPEVAASAPPDFPGSPVTAIVNEPSPGGPPVPGGEDELRRPQPLMASQKQLLNTELQSLKQKQEALWVRERDLKDMESVQELEQKRVEDSEMELRERQDFIEQQATRLDETLAALSDREEALQSQEEEIDEKMENLQAREDALDKVTRELRTKSIAQSDELDMDSVREEVDQRSREYSFEQEERLLGMQQELLSQSKKLIEQEREILKEEKAEIQGLEGEEEGEAPEPEEGAGEAAGEEAGGEEVEETKLDEAARFKQIAESLGGE